MWLWPSWSKTLIVSETVSWLFMPRHWLKMYDFISLDDLHKKGLILSFWIHGQKFFQNKKLLAPEKWHWPWLSGLKFNTHVSNTYLRLIVEAFLSNRLNCRDKWTFHYVYKFPSSLLSSILEKFQCRHLKWRIFLICCNFKLCTCPCKFSFTYRWTFVVDAIAVLA